jgi:sugar lactone lactonase YvrE
LFPKGVAVDNIGNVLIADTANTRVLFYPKGSTTSNRVYGQGGSFTSSTENLGGISATSINRAFGVGFDSNNNVYICDTENHRVLFYAGNSVTASRVYGQPSFTTSSGFGIGASASSLDSPMAITFDKSGNVYIADSSANRITIYTGTATVASAVVGQASFTTFASGLSASALNNPMGIALDASNNLYISDEVNNRVLKFSSGASSASSVIGQQGSFTSGNQNQGTISSSSLAFPLGIAIDVNNSLYVCDSQNNRLLCFGCPTSGTTTTGSTTTKPDFANNLVPQVLLLGLVLCFA